MAGVAAGRARERVGQYWDVQERREGRVTADEAGDGGHLVCLCVWE